MIQDLVTIIQEIKKLSDINSINNSGEMQDNLEKIHAKVCYIQETWPGYRNKENEL